MNINNTTITCAVKESYKNGNGQLTQGELYASVAEILNVNPDEHYDKVGKQNKVNLFYRKVRWVQQSLKSKKLLRKVDKGVWEVSGKDKEILHTISQAKSVIAMSTSLGIMICSKSEDVFKSGMIEDDIHLVLTSPPYILQNPRNYGGLSQAKEWVDFIISVIEPVLPRLADGASIVLNVGQDSFHKGMPARQTHIERLTIAMEDVGLWLVDRLIWTSNKAPTPYAWTSLNRFMLKSSYEFVLHFTNNPLKLMSNNQRVLEPHTETHKKFVLNGGTKRAASNSDGSHIKSVGDYSGSDLSKGKIPTNNLFYGNKCAKNEMVNRYARENNLPVHGAKMPYRLASFLVRYLTAEGDMVADIFGGTGAVASACEENGRGWISIEPVMEYIKQSFVRFTTLTDDIWINPLFSR
jgi:site-specific DNA-methyltransferase (cytosine-N4-specific)